MADVPSIPLLILAILAFVAVFAPVIAPHGKLDPVKPTPRAVSGEVRDGQLSLRRQRAAVLVQRRHASTRRSAPTSWDGTCCRRLMYGARISLVVALTGTLFAGAIGTLLGVLAGYMGKWWDQIIMRITDAWLTLPSLVFAILLSSVRGPGLWNVVLILALVFWSRYSRAVRGEVLALRERDFVRLAEINGDRQAHDHLRHLIPNVMNTVMVLFSLQVGVAVIIEASLSFLGVGVPPPEPSWGLMMAQERDR